MSLLVNTEQFVYLVHLCSFMCGFILTLSIIPDNSNVRIIILCTKHRERVSSLIIRGQYGISVLVLKNIKMEIIYLPGNP